MLTRLTIILTAWLLAGSANADTRLLMVESEYCHICKQWHREVGDAYPITDVGLVAPLLRHDIYDDLPLSVVLNSPAVYTPTFILLDDGHEVSRIEGYPGEHFFWGLVEMMLDKIPEKGDT